MLTLLAPQLSARLSISLQGYSQTKLALELMEQGANCNTRYDNQITPLMNAATLGLADLAQNFIESGADIEAKDRFQPDSITSCCFW